MKRAAFTTIELVLAVAVVGATGTILSPALTQSREKQMASVCQRNLRQIAMAVSLYAEDYGGHYPTNKSHPTQTVPSEQAFLTPPGRNQLQLTFVEGIERYLARAGTPRSNVPRTLKNAEQTVWTCPAVTVSYPTSSGVIPGFGDSRNCYGMNYHAHELRLSSVKDPARTLLFRELGVKGQSYSVGRPPSIGRRPTKAFLADADTWGLASATRSLHGAGSHILFADGHVRWFSNSVARLENLRNDVAGRPGDWALCENNDPTQLLLWYTP